MKQHFEYIEHWLKENASKILDCSLQGPAAESEIKELETVIGRKLPDDFKALYRWHNGLNDDENFGSLFYGMDFYPIDRIITAYSDQKENYGTPKITLNKADQEIDPSDMHNAAWIKFAFDGAHTGLYLDLAPGSGGTYGQIIFIDDEYETGILVARSTAALIGNLADDLNNNLYYLDEDALEDNDHYLTTDPKIDIVNWAMSEQWNR